MNIWVSVLTMCPGLWRERRGADPDQEESLGDPALPSPLTQPHLQEGAHPQPWPVLAQVNAAAQLPPGQRFSASSKPEKGKCQCSNRRTTSCNCPCDGSRSSREQGAGRTEQQHWGEHCKQFGCLSSLMAKIPTLSFQRSLCWMHTINQCLNTVIQLSVSEYAMGVGGFTF